MARILVPDYPGQQVIAGIKSLTESGDICDLAWDLNWLDHTFKSRHINQMIQIPSAETDPEGYIQGLLERLDQTPYDLILPFGNHACRQVVLAQQRIARKTRFLLPSIDNHSIAFDKALTYRHCLRHGIHVPQTISVNEKTRFLDGDLSTLQFPLVIKTKSGTGVREGVRFVEKQEDFEKNFSEVFRVYEKHGFNENYLPIIQEFIPGLIHDACVAAREGEIIAYLSQVRHLMYPVMGGVGAINYTTHNEELREIVTGLVKSLHWSGPAQIEFKYDERDQQFKLIEINPKLWGTLDLSIRSGVSFPRIIRDTLIARPIEPPVYNDGNFYFFLFPQATLATIEKAKLFGIGSIKIKELIQKRFYDVDISDPLPLIIRMIKTLIKAIPVLLSASGTKMDKKYLNP